MTLVVDEVRSTHLSPPATFVVLPTAESAPERSAEPETAPELRGSRRWAWAVLVAATAAAVTASIWAHVTGHVGLLGDEASHLLHARRVFDSATPGLGQIGQYWPPLYQILELPFVWIDPLYRSGWAGSIAGGIGYVGGVMGAYVLGTEVTRDRRSGVIAAIAFGANPSMLYLQSTAMMESAIAMGLVWSAAGLVRFWRTGRYRDVVLAGLGASLACWTHYGAWAMPLYGAVVVAIGCRRRGFGWRKTETYAVSYAIAAAYASVLWMMWNFYLQHNPVSFVQSSPPAPEVLSETFVNGRPGSVAYAATVYGLAVWHVLGPVLTVAVVGTLLVSLLRRRFFHPLGAALAATGFAVTLITLKGGSIGSPTFARWTGLTITHAYNDNIRYALWTAPFAAAAVAVIAGRSRLRQVATLFAVLAGLVWFLPGLGGTPAIDDPDTTSSLVIDRVVGAQLADAYDGGRVLLSSRNGGDRLIWHSGEDASQFITEFNGPLYAAAVALPRAHVRYVLITPRSSLEGRLSPSELERAGYSPVWTFDAYANGDLLYTLYERDRTLTGA